MEGKLFEKPIFRNVTTHGPQDIPLTDKDFYQYLHLIYDAAGYSEHPTIRDARRNLAKEVETQKGMAPRQSQILAQRDPKTFPEHYQAHCSSIDTVSAVLDEEVQTKHIEYFQGYGQICEPGLPLELPAHMKESILMLPKMAEMREDIQISEGNNDEEKLQAKKREYREALVRQRRADLKKYQESWIHVERDQNILNRGKGKPLHVVKDICTRAQYLIMPELARIATAMACTAELTFEEKLFFLGDLRTLCSRKEDVIYLPNEQPIEGFCPAQGCQLEIENLTKSERSAHIHECIRREKGLALQVPNSRLHFCYECMEWFLKRQWPDHCTAHLQSWQTQHCEAVKYRHTVIRPTYCPFCLWNFQNPAEERLQYWTRSGNLRQHIETKHMPEISWPVMTSICECSQTFDNERELCHHLHDVHGLKDTIWRNPKLPRKRKRTSKIEPQILSQKSEADYSKKLSNNIFVPTPTVNTFITEYPQKHYCSSRSEKSSSSSGSSSVVSYFSTANFPLSSRPTTPELDVIDPKILEVFDLDQENESQPLSMSRQQCARVMKETTSAQEESTISTSIGHQLPETEDDGNDDSLESEGNGPDPNREDSAEVPSKDKQALSHPMQRSDTKNWHRRLNARDRRKLLALKGKKMTLRQVGIQFAHLDTDFLRQVWGELNLPERCTRSR
ncbi:anticoagulant protein C [Aspergillus flavus]|uniref:Anticoagulant protein C n=1 Tax=Aspergillus flavus TaxID=5059 RepID=A0AB74BXK2_ASPFL|nr:anticoagulant protein C [Aspergillus flavus]